MCTQSIYKSPEGQARILELYDRLQGRLGVDLEDCVVHTRFGDTHVLASGPVHAQPLVITHGGNSINPQSLREILPILRANRYRIYAPDTIGHPGKSAQTRLSAQDLSYGEWLNEVLNELGLDQALFIGGSFGAGILLRLAAYAPQRITKLGLFVPSGVVKVPLTSMAFKIGLPYLLHLLAPSRRRFFRAIQWMGSEIDGDIVELIEAVFQHVRVEANMPRPATKMELAAFSAPTLVIAAEYDALFPGNRVVKRAREIISNLVDSECLKGETHYSSKRAMLYINRRMLEFMQAR